MGNSSVSSIGTDLPIDWNVSPVKLETWKGTLAVTGSEDMMSGLKNAIERLESLELVFSLDNWLIIKVPTAEDREITFSGQIPFGICLTFVNRKVSMYADVLGEWWLLQRKFAIIWESEMLKIVTM